jgi:hypothetical protein
MNRRKIILINLLIALLLVGYSKEVFACGCGSSPSSSIASYRATPNIVVVPPPPGFPHKWFTKEVINLFDKKGLKVSKPNPITERTKNNSIINTTNEAVKFDLISIGKDVGVSIHIFETWDDLDKAQKHFLDLNEKGELYTWSFVKDNVLLVLTGTIPEEVAREYESALYNLKE